MQIYHAIGDEADSVLRFVSFLHETCFGLLAQLEATSRLSRPKRHVPYGIALAALAGGMGFAWLEGGTSRVWWPYVIAVAMAAVLVKFVKERVSPSRDEPGVLIMAAVPVTVFSFWLSAAKSLAYGDWRLLFCPDIFVCSSETPVGSHSVLKYAPSPDGLLVHSTHSHELAIRDVAMWLWSSLNGDRP